MERTANPSRSMLAICDAELVVLVSAAVLVIAYRARGGDVGSVESISWLALVWAIRELVRTYLRRRAHRD